MKYLLILLFLFSFSSAWALPECEGSPNTGDDLSKTKHWDNCEGTHTFNNGDKYSGEFKGGLPNGQGTNTFANGNKYAGEYKDGKWHGQGTLTHTNGNKYVGEWKDSKKNGQGTFIWVSGRWKGNKYVGEWKDNKLNGQGTYTFAHGEKYVGEHKDGKKHGQGTNTFADGGKQLGEWKDDKRHGQGSIFFSDGRVWYGQWKNDNLVKWIKKYAANDPQAFEIIANQNRKEEDVRMQELESERLLEQEKNYETRKAQTKENRENNLNNAKLECEEIGFKKGTEAFGECVLDLTE
tara:strand:- start:159 stop:1037 length:879 start_codon:yes stop_codon:yes gene_type:complete